MPGMMPPPASQGAGARFFAEREREVVRLQCAKEVELQSRLGLQASSPRTPWVTAAEHPRAALPFAESTARRGHAARNRS